MPPIPPDQVAPYGPAAAFVQRLVPSRVVALRYGIHLRSLARWVARGVIPPPTQTINNRHYWSLEVLEQADRQRTIQAARGPRSTPGQPACLTSETSESAKP
jgi:hypothetical protein